jgi:hypothetical protein
VHVSGRRRVCGRPKNLRVLRNGSSILPVLQDKRQSGGLSGIGEDRIPILPAEDLSELMPQMLPIETYQRIA